MKNGDNMTPNLTKFCQKMETINWLGIEKNIRNLEKKLL